MLSGCFKDESNYNNSININKEKMVVLDSNVSFAKKRGFSSINCNKEEDMVEINDESGFFENSNFKIKVFDGYTENDELKFKKEYKKINIPVNLKWFSSQTKIDTAVLNRDGCSSIIFNQFVDGLIEDKFHFAVVKNKGNLKFEKANSKIELDNKNISLKIIKIIKSLQGKNESLSQRLKMDWADFNGDGIDDFLIAWDIRGDLFYEIMITDYYDDGIYFKENKSGSVKDFLKYKSIKNLDTEDFNGDGLADIVVLKSGINSISFGFAINKKEYFEPQKTIKKEKEIKTDILASAKKFDSFDINNDDKAEVVLITEKDDVPVMIYWNFNVRKI